MKGGAKGAGGGCTYIEEHFGLGRDEFLLARRRRGGVEEVICPRTTSLRAMLDTSSMRVCLGCVLLTELLLRLVEEPFLRGICRFADKPSTGDAKPANCDGEKIGVAANAYRVPP